jgi:hypothetical protein
MATSAWAEETIEEACEDINSQRCDTYLDNNFNWKSDKNKKNYPTGARVTKEEMEKIDKKWKSYPNNKAIAAGGYSEDMSIYLCYGHKSLSSATRCALNGCQSSGVACAIAVENDSTVDLEVAQENIGIARRNFSGDNSSSYSSGSQSQQKSTIDKCLERMAEAKVNFLKTCSGPATRLSPLSHHDASKKYCKNKANDRFDETQCFLSNPVTNENKTQYTLWLITNNGADRYATYDDYGQCMDTCQNLSQRCDCKAD